MQKINLFCLPFAGGNKYSYREFEKIAPPRLGVVPLEYPGRGSRAKEPFSRDIDQLVNDMYAAIDKRIEERDYAIYGHSLGALVAFYLARKIIVAGRRPPLHLFVSGTSGPSFESEGGKKWSAMSKTEFLQEVKKLDGMPEEILADEEMSNYMEPILRADFMLSETGRNRPGVLLELPITVINGTEEEITEEGISAWQNESCHTVDFRKLPGKHFFIFKETRWVIDIISEKLKV